MVVITIINIGIWIYALHYNNISGMNEIIGIFVFIIGFFIPFMLFGLISNQVERIENWISYKFGHTKIVKVNNGKPKKLSRRERKLAKAKVMECGTSEDSEGSTEEEMEVYEYYNIPTIYKKVIFIIITGMYYGAFYDISNKILMMLKISEDNYGRVENMAIVTGIQLFVEFCFLMGSLTS